MKITHDLLTLYKQKILAIAKYFDTFCTEHKLNYFCIAGTAIGALRHNGMIPWDDDIDFVMPRPDYEKFIKLQHKLDRSYDLFTHHNNKFYHLPYAKLCDANTTLLPNLRYKCVIGAFIDIFPLDGLPNHSKVEQINFFNEFIKIRKIATGINTYYNLNDLIHAIYRKDFLEIKSQIYSHYYHLCKKQNDYFDKCDNYLSQNQYDKSDYVAYFGTNRGAKVISPKKWFESYYYHEFEDFSLRMPIGIHKYLTNVYGNYMSPPPPEERILLHSYYFLDLNHRLSMKQIKKINAK